MEEYLHNFKGIAKDGGPPPLNPGECVIFGEQGMGLLPATLGIGSNWTCWRLLKHLRPLYLAPVAWCLSQLVPRITKNDDEPTCFTSVRN